MGRCWTPLALTLLVLVLTFVPNGRTARANRPQIRHQETPTPQAPTATKPKENLACSLDTCSWKENRWCFKEPGYEMAACVCRPGFAPVGEDCVEAMTFHLYVLLPGETMASMNNHKSWHYKKTTEEFTNTISELHNNGKFQGLDAEFLAVSSVYYAGGMPKAIIAKSLIHYRPSSVISPDALELTLQNSVSRTPGAGLLLDKETMEVTDENECLIKGGHLSDCHPDAECRNTLGSFECVCKEGTVDMSYAFGAPAGRFCYGKCTTWRCEDPEEIVHIDTLRGEETMCVSPETRDMCHMTSPIPGWLTDWGDLRLWLVLLGFVVVVVGLVILIAYLCRMYSRNKAKRMEKKRSSHELYSEYWPCHRVRKVSIIGFDIKRRDSFQPKAAGQASKIKMASSTGRKSVSDTNGTGTMHWNLSATRLPSKPGEEQGSKCSGCKVSDEDETVYSAENNAI